MSSSQDRRALAALAAVTVFTTAVPLVTTFLLSERYTISGLTAVAFAPAIVNLVIGVGAMLWVSRG